MMEILNDQQRKRFRELRHSEFNGCLNADEQAELAALMQRIEDAEAAYLRPAAERQEARIQGLEAQNRALEALAKRKEALVQRLEQTLAEARRERAVIAAEQKRLMQAIEPQGEFSSAGGTR